ncbi:hypothetical protein [Krasilnikoviella flava]|uniref:Sulfotransferase family protein n=1 Tax=Krasilnikoviella flava TaxID=526729 RepID=A0A1T5L5Y0_9MICO|nr:hypothetical protein [Krasilnikoviella flava]SKC71457.1 hypothetical protein SAMN04324258_2992 [Krasilnikoviella flava]
MPRRVFLHVGTPKSGTTYLQSRLHANRRELRRHGVLYPTGALGEPRLHYWAALDLTGTDHGVDRGRVEGAWDRLLRQVRRARGDVVVSHEVLAKATPDQAARALADLGSTGAEVRVVLTARDLARELASGWQETLKFGSRTTLRAFLDRAREGRSAFLESFDPTRVLTVWGAGLPASRLHVVTAPPPGGSGGLLWLRFLDVVDVDPAWAPREAERANTSVGVPEAQVLRRLNRRLGDDARRGGELSPIVDGIVVGDALAPRRSAPITLGPDDHAWTTGLSATWIAWLEGRGVSVHGDLDDLVPVAPAEDWTDPDVPMPRQVTAAALDAVEVLLAEVRDRPLPWRERARRALARVRG